MVTRGGSSSPAYRALSSAARMPNDQASATRWCTATPSRCTSVASSSSTTRSSGPSSRRNGCLSTDSRSSVRCRWNSSAAVSGSATCIIGRSSARTTCDRRASCRRTRSAKARWSRSTSSGPVRRTTVRIEYGSTPSSISCRTQSRSWAKDSGAVVTVCPPLGRGGGPSIGWSGARTPRRRRHRAARTRRGCGSSAARL